MHRSVAPKVDS